MIVECYDCGHFHGRDASGKLLDVAHVGLGRCSFEKQTGHFVSGGYPRECRNFVECGKGSHRRVWVQSKSTLLEGK